MSHDNINVITDCSGYQDAWSRVSPQLLQPHVKKERTFLEIDVCMKRYPCISDASLRDFYTLKCDQAANIVCVGASARKRSVELFVCEKVSFKMLVIFSADHYILVCS